MARSDIVHLHFHGCQVSRLGLERTQDLQAGRGPEPLEGLLGMLLEAELIGHGRIGAHDVMAPDVFSLWRIDCCLARVFLEMGDPGSHVTVLAFYPAARIGSLKPFRIGLFQR